MRSLKSLFSHLSHQYQVCGDGADFRKIEGKQIAVKEISLYQTTKGNW